MNIKRFASEDNVFVNYECIKGYAFKNAAAWVKSAILPVICAVWGLSGDNCAHFCRIECLLPKYYTCTA